MAAWQTSTRRQRLPKDWNRRAARVRRRDKVCQWPTPDGVCGAPGRDVDHKVRGDDHSYANLWLLCGRHHDAKTKAETAEGRAAFNANRPRRQRKPDPHPGLIDADAG